MHSPLGNYLDGPIRVGPVWKCSPSSTKNISVYTSPNQSQHYRWNTISCPRANANTNANGFKLFWALNKPGLVQTVLLMGLQSLREHMCTFSFSDISACTQAKINTHTYCACALKYVKYLLHLLFVFVLLFHFLLLNCSFIYCCCASSYFSCLKLDLKWCLLGKSRWFFSLHRC